MSHPLYDNDQYRAVFCELFKITKTDQTAQPFIPSVPDNWFLLPFPKIMWCGAATNGWETKNSKTWSFEQNLHETREFTNPNNKQGLAKYKSGSAFWRVQKKCADVLNIKCSTFIWNNLFKIGGDTDNPKHSLARKQLPLCLKAFELEKFILKPDLVVLHTGQLANIFFKTAQGRSEIFPNIWESWVQEKGGLSACVVHNGQSYIWLSRSRVSSDRLLSESFFKSYNRLRTI